ncbi:hypothetical protein Btru_026689 [Bulinus truncatus]|nr:hypothetical protein Btru_026689 [Bulinus truncatus]
MFKLTECTFLCDTGKCSTDQWECYDGECIPLWSRCSGLDVCRDGSNNKNCVTCGAHTTKCRNGNCIYKTYLCDGYNDCGDGSDEESWHVFY